MDPVTAGFIVTVIQLIMKYGIPGAVRVLNEWAPAGDTVTAEDIRELRKKMPHPDDFPIKAK